MILIIDDDKSIREGFMMLLKSAGYKCACFASAESFLKDYNNSGADMLLLDIHLMGMDGCEFLVKIRNQLSELPIIVITAFDQPHYIECCKQQGVLAYLRKPVDGEALLDLIKYHFKDFRNHTHKTLS